jgi:Zn-dependent peptidase ImmA (M78 family)
MLLRKHGVETLPIPVEDIARAEGAIVVRKSFDGTQSGFALRDGATRIIGVNSANSPRRQRFTIAHELGHLDLHEGRQLTVDHSMRVDWRDETSSLGTDKQEVEANAFAAALLMPKSLINKQIRVHLHGNSMARDALISALARDFDVSAEAMGYRLINLGILA